MKTKIFNPLVSIVIPVFNGANYMREAIDSALNQTYKNIEVIVVNDGSTDQTEKIAKSYGDKIRYIRKNNGGVASALNLAIKNSKGEYISWLSHDDVYLKNKIFLQIKFLNELSNQNKFNSILYSNYVLVDNKLNNIKSFNLENILSEKELNTQLLPLFMGLIHGCTLLIPKECFLKISFFNEFLTTTQDYDLWLKMFPKYNLFFQPHCYVKSRSHEEQNSKSLSEIHFRESEEMWLRAVESLTKKDVEKVSGDFFHFYFRLYSRFKNANLPKISRICLLKSLNITRKNGNLLFITATLDGGLGKYLHDLNQRLSSNYNTYILYIKNYDVSLFFNNVEIFKFKLRKRIDYSEMFENDELTNVIVSFVNLLSIDLIHMNGFFYIGFNFLFAIKKIRVPIVYTIHDFSLLCFSLFFLNNHSEYCGMNKNPKICAHCLKNNKYTSFLGEVNEKKLFMYRTYIERFVLPNLDCVIYPSLFAKNTFEKFYPFLKEKNAAIIPHGVEKKHISTANQLKRHQRIRVGIIGNIEDHKGLKEIELILNSTELSKEKFEFILFGKYNKKTSALKFVPLSNYFDTTNILLKNKISIMLILSRAPETFSYVLSESWSASIPVIVTNIGALKERVIHNGGGFIVPIENTHSEVISILNKIYNNSEILENKIKEIQAMHLPTVNNMLTKTIHVYKKLIKNNPKIETDISQSTKELILYNFLHYNDLEESQLIKEKIALDKIYKLPLIGHLLVRTYLRSKKVIVWIKNK